MTHDPKLIEAIADYRIVLNTSIGGRLGEYAANGILERLHAAGYKVLAREPTYDMLLAMKNRDTQSAKFYAAWDAAPGEKP